MPYFEETLLEDGYADMYAILEQLARCGYDGQLNIDHSFFNPDGKGMSKTSEALFPGILEGNAGKSGASAETGKGEWR